MMDSISSSSSSSNAVRSRQKLCSFSKMPSTARAFSGFTGYRRQSLAMYRHTAMVPVTPHAPDSVQTVGVRMSSSSQHCSSPGMSTCESTSQRINRSTDPGVPAKTRNFRGVGCAVSNTQCFTDPHRWWSEREAPILQMTPSLGLLHTGVLKKDVHILNATNHYFFPECFHCEYVERGASDHVEE